MPLCYFFNVKEKILIKFISGKQKLNYVIIAKTHILPTYSLQVNEIFLRHIFFNIT
jgi:hypothetical protein